MAGEIRLTGLASGIDTETLIQRILDVERIPITRLKADKSKLTAKDDAVSAIKSSLTSLQNNISNLKDPAFFASNIATSSDTTVATATATSSAAKSTYTVVISSLASAGTLKSGTSLGPAAQKISNTITAGDLLTANTSYGSSLTLGTFTVNGASVTIDSTDTLTSTLTKINTATGGNVTGTYNAATDTISLTAASGTLVLGGSADTSNFLVRSRLYTNGTNAVTSLTSVGNIDTTAVIGDASSRIGAYSSLTSGTITVNGVSISIDTTVDTMQNVLDRITASSANVYASYDSIEDRMVLTSKVTGSTGIAVADGTSNFASSMKLTNTTSQVTAGNDTTFTINGGVSRKSADLTLSETESGIAGLTISAVKTGTFTLTVGTDTARIQSELSDFVSQYNSLQNIISSYTATPPEDANPLDSQYILSNDSLVTSLPNEIRKLVMAAPGTGTYRMLEDLGVTANGSDNLLEFTDPAKLTSALATNLSDVISVFTDSTTGIMNQLDSFLDTQLDSAVGAFPTRIANDEIESSRIDDKIANLEDQIKKEEDRLVASFAAMEQYSARNQNILNFLKQTSSGR